MKDQANETKTDFKLGEKPRNIPVKKIYFFGFFLVHPGFF